MIMWDRNIWEDELEMKTSLQIYNKNNWFQRQQPTSGGTVRSSDLQIVVNTSFQTVSSTVFRTRVSLQRLS